LVGRLLFSTLKTLPLIIFLWTYSDHHTRRKVTMAKYKPETLSEFCPGNGYVFLSFQQYFLAFFLVLPSRKLLHVPFVEAV